MLGDVGSVGGLGNDVTHSCQFKVFTLHETHVAPAFILSLVPQQYRCLVVLYANSCLKT